MLTAGTIYLTILEGDSKLLALVRFLKHTHAIDRRRVHA